MFGRRNGRQCPHFQAHSRHVGFYADGSDTKEVDKDGVATGKWICRFECECTECHDTMTVSFLLPQPIKAPEGWWP